jgi:hypothetical protein
MVVCERFIFLVNINHTLRTFPIYLPGFSDRFSLAGTPGEPENIFRAEITRLWIRITPERFTRIRSDTRCVRSDQPSCALKSAIIIP